MKEWQEESFRSLKGQSVYQPFLGTGAVCFLWSSQPDIYLSRLQSAHCLYSYFWDEYSAQWPPPWVPFWSFIFEIQLSCLPFLHHFSIYCVVLPAAVSFLCALSELPKATVQFSRPLGPSAWNWSGPTVQTPACWDCGFEPRRGMMSVPC
jgi:hypothetical protein